MKNYQLAFILMYLVIIPDFGMKAQYRDKSWREIVLLDDSTWFGSPEAKEIAENVLLYQRNIGAWPKNVEIHKLLDDRGKHKLMQLKSSSEDCTIDNGATNQEMLFLSKIYRKIPDDSYKTAFLSGLEYLLDAQYENGGWPQFYPAGEGYSSQITYNDDAMVNTLRTLREIAYETDYFSIRPEKNTIERVKMAFNKGIDCILKTQYKQNGILTGWCAQHDKITLLPAKARAYELPSLSGKESSQIVLLLMSIPNPSSDVVKAIESAVAWFEKTKILGIKELKIYHDNGKIIDKIIVKDVDASPIWARFMELDDGKPFFCDRDGIKKYSLSEIGIERKTGYAWYTNEPEELLKQYPVWKKKNEVLISKKNASKKAKNPCCIIVAQDSSGDYLSIQKAINEAQSFPYQRITIYIKNGIYKEKVKVHEWNTNLSLVGESKENTIISYNDYFDKINLGPNSTFYTPTLLVEGDGFIAQNLTIENSAGDIGQAVALSVFADKVKIENCNIIGNQDTLYASGNNARQYYKNCYIEGTTDFIFGRATAYFENCIIHSKKDAYITAASTPKDVHYGFVFFKCQLTANDDVGKVYLGRPWRIYARTVFLYCQMDKHILPLGWHNWSKPEAEKTTFYAEYMSKGMGANPYKRVTWSHQLKKSELKKYEIEHVLGKEKWYWQ